MDASLFLEDFFGRSRISPIIKGLNSCSLWSSFGWFTKRNFSEVPAFSVGPFQKVQREVSHFPYVARKNAATNFPKFAAYTVKFVKFLVRIISEHPQKAILLMFETEIFRPYLVRKLK